MKIFIMASALSLGLVLVARADDVDDLFFAVTNIYGVSGETTPSGGGYAERLFVPEHE
ncbi:hypothetical protein [Rhizobium mesoamericanum]|uniref:hypothetical protein n=1 Tax=Rhizobium mesoamericanum TaxID=1079800 RepID=UPI00138AD971|nr:hypothetical protein [Rhizobium mesoamericanum]